MSVMISIEGHCVRDDTHKVLCIKSIDALGNLMIVIMLM